MSLKLNRRLVAVLACLFVLATLFGTYFAFAPEAEAGCTHGDTRWVYAGCCVSGTSYKTKFKLEWCNNGTWTGTGVTDCRYNACIV